MHFILAIVWSWTIFSVSEKEQQQIKTQMKRIKRKRKSSKSSIEDADTLRFAFNWSVTHSSSQHDYTKYNRNLRKRLLTGWFFDIPIKKLNEEKRMIKAEKKIKWRLFALQFRSEHGGFSIAPEISCMTASWSFIVVSSRISLGHRFEIKPKQKNSLKIGYWCWSHLVKISNHLAIEGHA